MIIKSVKTDAITEKNFSIHLEKGRTDYLYVLFKTRTMLWVEGEYICVEAGTGIFYDKNKTQSYYGCDEREFNHDFLLFDLEDNFEKNLFSNIVKNKPLNHASIDGLSDALAAIEKENTPSKFKKEILSNLGIVFLYKVLDDLNFPSLADELRQHYKIFYEIRKEIYQKPYCEWNIENVSKRIGFSRCYFQHLYKNFFKVSCIGDVINARVDMAKSLLLSTNLSVSDIAEKCGYKNTEHFIRQFKNIVGITPGKFGK